MNQEHLLYNSRFLKDYTLAILQVIEKNKFNITEEKQVIKSNLIPKFAEVLDNEYSLNKELIKKLKTIENLEVPQKPLVTPSQTIEQRPLRKPKKIPPMKKGVQRVHGAVKAPEQPQVSGDVDKTNGYQKIKPLIDDYSVSRIQCVSPNKPLIIIRTGQKQVTKISLTSQQIKDVFEALAEQAHIPLIEGPFKIILDEFTIDGIYSNLANARFIIQKQTAYSLLEQGRR